MNKMIGVISKADWSKAPEGATHVKSDNAGWYRYDCATELHLLNSRGEYRSTYTSVEDFNSVGGVKLISKEEDLQMDKKEVSKQVSSIADLEDGLFFKTDDGHTYVVLYGDSVYKQCWNMQNCNEAGWGESGFSKIISWSYTYNGEYTPIVKETEAERKIKELEATIALAQKQLQEYKEMK